MPLVSLFPRVFFSPRRPLSPPSHTAQVDSASHSPPPPSMPFTFWGYAPSKVKTQCQLGTARIKLLRNKKQVQVREREGRAW